MPAKYRVAAQMFGFRDYTKTLADAAKTMKRVKKIGYDYCQISGFGPMDMADLKRVCDDAGVTPIGAHIGLPAFRENEKKVLEDCRKLGISYVAIPWLRASDQKTLADWKALFREFEGYAKRFAKEGVVVQYHNHDFEFNQFFIKNGKGGKTILEMMFETCKVLQGEPDFGWVMRGGMDPVLWAERMKGRMDQVHLKDWGLIGGEFAFRALGEGRINWPAVVKACKKGGTHTFIVEQDSCKATNDPFRSLQISREYLKGFLG